MSPLRSKRHLNEVLHSSVTLERWKKTRALLICIFLNMLKSSCSTTLRLTLRCLAVGFYDSICQKSITLDSYHLPVFCFMENETHLHIYDFIWCGFIAVWLKVLWEKDCKDHFEQKLLFSTINLYTDNTPWYFSVWGKRILFKSCSLGVFAFRCFFLNSFGEIKIETKQAIVGIHLITEHECKYSPF